MGSEPHNERPLTFQPRRRPVCAPAVDTCGDDEHNQSGSGVTEKEAFVCVHSSSLFVCPHLFISCKFTFSHLAWLSESLFEDIWHFFIYLFTYFTYSKPWEVSIQCPLFCAIQLLRHTGNASDVLRQLFIVCVCVCCCYVEGEREWLGTISADWSSCVTLLTDVRLIITWLTSCCDAFTDPPGGRGGGAGGR